MPILARILLREFLGLRHSGDRVQHVLQTVFVYQRFDADFDIADRRFFFLDFPSRLSS